MIMKICIAAAVALGCTFAVPDASFAAGEQGKSVTTEKLKATKHHKKPKKGFSDDAHDVPYYTGGQVGEPQGLDYARGQRGQPRGGLAR